MNHLPCFERDPYQQVLETGVREAWQDQGASFAVLEDTLFYPEGGGQPADRGEINGVAVLDVQKQEGRIVHRLERAVEVGPARLVLDWTAGATVVGVVPEFDTECLAGMLGRHGLSPQWVSTVDVLPLAVTAVRELGLDPEPHHEDLSRQCGVKPPSGAERHTAVGDARWAMRWYDALTLKRSSTPGR